MLLPTYPASIFYALRPVDETSSWRIRLVGRRQHAHRSPQGHTNGQPRALVLGSQRQQRGGTTRDVVSSGQGLRHHDVLPTGTGTAYSKVVTRYKRVLTGQELGKWRRIRSLYCLI
jgi:hypothetical protein